MKLFTQLLVLGLAAEATVASTWFSKAGKSDMSLQTSPESKLWPTIDRTAHLLLLL